MLHKSMWLPTLSFVISGRFQFMSTFRRVAAAGMGPTGPMGAYWGKVPLKNT